MKPARLNTSMEAGSTLPVIATMGIETPAARIAEHTCEGSAKNGTRCVHGVSVISKCRKKKSRTAHITHPTSSQDADSRPRNANLHAIRALHDNVKQHEASAGLDGVDELRAVL